VNVDPPKGISFDVDVKTRQIFVRGSAEQVGQVAGRRKVRHLNRIKAKGLKYLAEKVRRKAGKTARCESMSENRSYSRIQRHKQVPAHRRVVKRPRLNVFRSFGDLRTVIDDKAGKTWLRLRRSTISCAKIWKAYPKPSKLARSARQSPSAKGGWVQVVLDRGGYRYVGV
jgi:hypothetical protein